VNERNHDSVKLRHKNGLKEKKIKVNCSSYIISTRAVFPLVKQQLLSDCII
jgi:hypothetical protein